MSNTEFNVAVFKAWPVSLPSKGVTDNAPLENRENTSAGTLIKIALQSAFAWNQCYVQIE